MKTARIMTLLTISALTFCEPAVSQTSSKSDNASKMEEAKAGIAKILNDKVEILDKQSQLSGDPVDLAVTDDRIEFKIKKQKAVIYFMDFIDEYIAGPGYRKAKIVMSLGKFEFITNGWVTSNLIRLEELRQYLVFIQKQSKKKRYESELILFEPVAAKYRELKVKPPVSEEQRKYIVQANSTSGQGLFNKAIEIYNKALELDQTSYPAGYSNVALLSAQIKDYDGAIYYMKKYLLLEPEARMPAAPRTRFMNGN